jgi:FkbM family methyltransferase
MISTTDLLDNLPAAPVVIEAGAHLGEDTIALARFAEHVYAFEPVPALYVLANHATAEYPNVTVAPMALGEVDTMADMWVANDASSSLMSPVEHFQYYPHITFVEKIRVPVTTIASWALRENVDHVDGAWLDIQGAELAALKSAGPLLDTIHAIMLEVSLVELYENNPLWPEVREWLQMRGFQVVIEDLYSGHAGDALVVRS